MKQKYEITDRAGPYVAGIRVAGLVADSDGKKRLDLTEAEAHFDLHTGALSLPQPTPTPVRKAESKG